MDDSPQLVRVLVVEDDYLARQGARDVLEQADRIELVAAVASAGELPALITGKEVHAAVIDACLSPSHSAEGLELANRLRRERPRIGIVILCQHADREHTLELLDEGVQGCAYLLKERVGDAEQLVESIRRVVRGESVLDPMIVDCLVAARQQDANSRLSELTPRETEVLALMAEGKVNAAIAKELFISERSVEKHATAIFSKLGVSQAPGLNPRVAAVAYFLHRCNDLPPQGPGPAAGRRVSELPELCLPSDDELGG